jgi:hypothetical protein
VQLYELALSSSGLAIPSTGDFNGDGNVDGRDLLVWQRTLGASGANLGTDGNHDGVVNAADLALWRQSFGDASSVVAGAQGVPEPAGIQLVLALMTCSLRAPHSHLSRKNSPCINK